MATYNPDVDLDEFCASVERMMPPREGAHIVGFAERLFSFFKIRGWLNDTTLTVGTMIQLMFAEMADNPKRFVEQVR